MENLRLAFQGIWSHKLRSVLTMLGIIIGIAAIIAIVSTIRGTNEQIKENLIGSGTNAVVVRLYEDDSEADLQYSGNPSDVRVISEDTRKELEELPDVAAVSLFRSRSWSDSVYYGNTSFNGATLGVDLHYFDVYQYALCYGRNFTEADLANHRKVVILDSTAASTLFYGVNPIGQVLEMNGQPFTVIGVVAPTKTSHPTIETLNDYYMQRDSASTGKLYVTEAAWPILYRFDEPQSVALRAASTDAMTTVGQSAAKLLNESQVTSRSSSFSYRSQDLLEQATRLQESNNATNTQLIWIAGISLLVGGIGVLNIMLVSVAERTSEIGLKKAIGAKKRRILWQFLTEAAVLTSLGGLIGVFAGIGAAFFLSSATGTPVAISVPAAIIAVVFSMLIGIVFGLLPARKAANMNPIEALRRD